MPRKLTDPPFRPVTPMSILAAKLDSTYQRAALHTVIDSEFRDDFQGLVALATGLDPYVANCTSPESADLTALVHATQAADWSHLYAAGQTAVALEQEMVSGHVEGQFLKMLVHALKATNILEIGLFTGYSALAMAEALPSSGTLIACEIDAYAAQFASAMFAKSVHGHKITVEHGPAINTLKKLSGRGDSFDLIFIDADKGGYVDYFQAILDGGLLAGGGLICVDNTLMQGEPYLPGKPSANGKAIAQFNRVVAEDRRVEQVMLPLRDGLTLIRQA